MDQSWCDEDLNDDNQIFALFSYGVTMTWEATKEFRFKKINFFL